MPPWISTIVASVTSIIVAIISSQWFAKKLMKKDITENLQSSINDLRESVDNNNKTAETLKDANVALLKERFEYLSTKALRRGSVTIDELQVIRKLSVPYFRLDDADGSGKVLLKKVEELPIREETASG